MDCSLTLTCVPSFCEALKGPVKSNPKCVAHVLICYVTFQMLVMLMEQFHIFPFDVFILMIMCMYLTVTAWLH